VDLSSQIAAQQAQPVPHASAQRTAPPVVTTASSSSTLPARGYTVDQLIGYIQRQLGSPVWNVELSNQQIADAIQDAMVLYSTWRPVWRFGSIMLQRGQFEYLKGIDLGQGPVQLDFVQPNPVPAELFWGNLLDPAPLLRNGLDELDSFLRWVKVWMRVTSIQPNWQYDQARQVLYIWNPLDRYQCGLQFYEPYKDTKSLDNWGAVWVKDYALQKARLLLGEIFAKFSGAIPGPAQNLQLDLQKRDKAETRLKELEEKLQGAQITCPIQID
jgi:hypothetical protein